MRIYVGLEYWQEDWEKHGTNIVMANTNLGTEFRNCDEVEVWEDGIRVKSVKWSHWSEEWRDY